ncbi:MAG: hypothetical protein ACI8TL_000360, partial [Natronomonas sp.]
MVTSREHDGVCTPQAVPVLDTADARHDALLCAGYLPVAALATELADTLDELEKTAGESDLPGRYLPAGRVHGSLAVVGNIGFGDERPA